MSNIHIEQGDLLKAPAEALVNTVNCVGVMGKGIALQFERTYPEIVAPYKKACKDKTLRPGQVQVVERSLILDGPRVIFNFATKDHWRQGSQLSWIKTGLAYLVQEIKARGITSVALPPLGCGNGGLNWHDVHPLIETAFAEAPEVNVLLYPPQGAPDPQKMEPGQPPKMSVPNALYLHLLNVYSYVEQTFSHLELQKLAYFLERAGEPNLRLNFTKERYGPYAPELRQVLNRWENYWTSGFGDNTGDAARLMTLHPHAAEDADEYLQEHATPETWQRLKHVLGLIEGFDTAKGLELLATTHWVAHHENARTVEEAIEAVRNWSEYKAQTFKPDYVALAWGRLLEKGWLPVTSAEVTADDPKVKDWRIAYKSDSTAGVEAFVAAHRALEDVLVDAIIPLQSIFPEGKFHLNVLADRESGNEQLWIEIETPADTPREQAHARLAEFDRAWWNGRAAEWFGILGIGLV